jgi:MFS family permease
MTTAPGPQPPPRRGVLGVAQFALVLDVAVVNAALVPLARGLGVAADGLQLVASAYAACFGGALLLGARLADGGRRRRTFLAGLVLSGAASLVCGAAGSVAVPGRHRAGFLPITAVSASTATASARLAARWGPRPLLVASMVAMTAVVVTARAGDPRRARERYAGHAPALVSPRCRGAVRLGPARRAWRVLVRRLRRC